MRRTVFVGKKKERAAEVWYLLAWPTEGREHQQNLQRAYRSPLLSVLFTFFTMGLNTHRRYLVAVLTVILLRK